MKFHPHGGDESSATIPFPRVHRPVWIGDLRPARLQEEGEVGPQDAEKGNRSRRDNQCLQD